MTGPFVEERIGDAPNECGTEQTSWTHQERHQASREPLGRGQIGRSLTGAIQDQKLVLEEKPLRKYRGILRNRGRNNNSPETASLRTFRIAQSDNLFEIVSSHLNASHSQMAFEEIGRERHSAAPHFPQRDWGAWVI
jgi:hypothetical protein